MKFTSAVVTATLLTAGAVNTLAFTTNQMPKSMGISSSSALFLSPEDLTNAMAKAHEEKIRAMKDIEDKKNAEIKALKIEMENLKTNQQSLPAAAAAPPAIVPSKNFSLDITNMSKEQLAGRLVTYQQFMSRYIVEAQEQKMKAVKAAEAAVAAKYEQKLQLYQAKVETPPTPAIPDAPATKLYDSRNANIAAAAAAGKSRWGDMEVAKAKGKSPAVNGMQVNGATVPVIEDKADPNAIAILSGNSLYYHRNQMVAAAGAAGKSRWGDAEVKKATTEAAKGPPSLSAAPAAAAAAPVQASAAPTTPAPEAPKIIVTPEIEAADHGLRHDGGVGGPTLAERVNLGEQLFANGSAPAGKGKASASLYDSRNARVAAAAAAGKSRWGTMENERASSLLSNASPNGASATAIAVEVPPEVEAADHGLRADGGVGGPSLAQRVNLGANLLAP